VWTSERQRVRLPAPATGMFGGRERFEDNFRAVGNWWLAHRGPNWQSGYAAPSPQALR
jgi:hypothetical protein